MKKETKPGTQNRSNDGSKLGSEEEHKLEEKAKRALENLNIDKALQHLNEAMGGRNESNAGYDRSFGTFNTVAAASSFRTRATARSRLETLSVSA